MMQTIGPYEIAGLLATGGMAEILLGRRVGPSGFERVVVIKRILSTLAKDVSYVRMFVDEARISARINHSNVVQVFDLIIEEELLCIVMEYLKGETLASVFRRASTRDIHLDAQLCSYIVSEAAAGLHAAHELVDDTNAPVGLVHRDVTPQNIFVTYDGSIKLLDFGIAKAKDRVTQTQTGQLKGSYAYMSPEQCRGETLDRRSDIFSLGVVLYEISSGHRLFRRANHLLTLKAVVDGPIVAPTTLVSDYPSRLEDLCLRALTRDRSKRYQTAAELRQDLLSVIVDVRSRGLPEVRLGELMQELFSDRIQEKEDLLQNLRHGRRISQCPAPETDLAASIPTVSDFVSNLEVEPTVEEPPTPRRLKWLIAIGFLLLLSLGGLVVLFASGQEGASSDDPTPEQHGGNQSAATNVAPQDTTPSEPTKVVLNIESSPPEALVWIDDIFRGVTPTAIEVPRSSADVELRLFKEGYVPIRMSLVPETEQRLALMLVADTSTEDRQGMDSGVEADGGRSDHGMKARRWKRRWMHAHQKSEEAPEEIRSKYRRFD